MKSGILLLILALVIQSCAMELGNTTSTPSTGKCYCLSLVPNQYEIVEQKFAIYTGENLDERLLEQKNIVLLPGSKTIGKDKDGKNVIITKSDSTALFWAVKDTNATKEYRIQTFKTYKLTKQGEGEKWTEMLCYNKQDSRIITQIQNALTKTGHYTGPIDGILNPSTCTALKQFQIEKNLPEGIYQIATLEALGVKF